MVYRCRREEEFGGCGWSTVHYDEVDAHEEQVEPGHWVLGRIEQVRVTEDGERAELQAGLQEEGRRLASEREDLIVRGVDPSLLAVPIGSLADPKETQAVEQAESKQVEQALAQADEVNRELNEISHAAYAGSSSRSPERDVRFLLSLLSCHSGRDGECSWERCPQLRDGEPVRSGRHCPLDWHDD